ncbi:Glycosyltransferase [Rhodovastum atsumiense]|nr:glycosyltransferase [Rhodovastum atsumiense]CAH2603367.1 Glycosyltransferase [Rhodovastum atsumiense]
MRRLNAKSAEQPLRDIGAILQGSDRGRNAEAGFAVALAVEALAHESSEAALRHLEYAQRAAPSDGGIMLAIGLLRLHAGDPRALEALELLAGQTGSRDVLFQLAQMRRHFSGPDHAAAELHRTLTGNAPPLTVPFCRLAAELSEATGAKGWCGLDNAGVLHIGGAAARLRRNGLEILLDGQPARIGPPQKGAVEGTVALALNEPWARKARLEVFARSLPLIGSPIAIGQVTRMEGFVQEAAGGLSGWCWLPGQPELSPRVTLRGAQGKGRQRSVVAKAPLVDLRGFPFGAQPRGFIFGAEAVAALGGTVHVEGPHGRALYGSPLTPGQMIASARRAAQGVRALFPPGGASAADPVPAGVGPIAEPSIPADLVGPKPPYGRPALPRPVDIVVPVYRGLKVTLDCLESVLAARSLADERVVVVVDDSPDRELVAALQRMAGAGRIVLSLQPVNRGFPATANVGLRLSRGRDVVLLNSDTLTPPGWVERLQRIVYGADDIGTATPLSNDATIFSYPRTNAANPLPDADAIARLAALAAEANGDACVDVPTAHGFCMYIRTECLEDTGLLREDVFAQGYGEENDFCRRASLFGWRHVAAPGAFVGHAGSQSFSATRTHLIARNLAILNRLHVGYDSLVQAWLAADPLVPFRRRLDRARLNAEMGDAATVLLVTHDRGGGVQKCVRDRVAMLREQGKRPVVLRPETKGEAVFCRLEVGAGDGFPNLVFGMSQEMEEMLALLRALAPAEIEFHHFIRHPPELIRALTGFGVPYDIYLHDYSWYCPQITLTAGGNRYCGEVSPAACGPCHAEHGSKLNEEITPTALRTRSAALFAGARQVVAPSRDCARRFERWLGAEVTVAPWEPMRELRLRGGGAEKPRRRVCVLGAIGREKGYDTLLRCASLVAEQDLPLEFVVVGYSCDDRRLLQTGRVTITGRYEEPEAVGLVRAQQADLGFLPSLWPETWSFTLSQMWEAGLPVIAYDIGTPAERIRSMQGGLVVPLHMPVEKLVSLFLLQTMKSAAEKAA